MVHEGVARGIGGVDDAQRCCMRDGLVSRSSCTRDWQALWGWWCRRALHDGRGWFHTCVARGCCTRGEVVGWWCTRASHEGCGDFLAVLHEGLASGTLGGCCTRALHEDGAGVSREHGGVHGGVTRGCCVGNCGWPLHNDLHERSGRGFSPELYRRAVRCFARGHCTRAIIGDATFMGGVPTPI